MDADLSSSEVRTSDLIFRWIDGYYDGILSGFATWQGKLCYFEICDDTTDDRKFTIHSLSADEANTATRDYEAFKARWGDHLDLLPDGTRAGGTCRGTIEEAAAEGDAIAAAMAAGTWQPPVSYHCNPIIGWFTSTIF